MDINQEEHTTILTNPMQYTIPKYLEAEVTEHDADLLFRYVYHFPRNHPFSFNKFYHLFIDSISVDKSIRNEFEFISELMFINNRTLLFPKLTHYRVDFITHDADEFEFKPTETIITNEAQLQELYYNFLDSEQPLYLVFRGEHPEPAYQEAFKIKPAIALAYLYTYSSHNVDGDNLEGLWNMAKNHVLKMFNDQKMREELLRQKIADYRQSHY